MQGFNRSLAIRHDPRHRRLAIDIHSKPNGMRETGDKKIAALNIHQRFTKDRRKSYVNTMKSFAAQLAKVFFCIFDGNLKRPCFLSMLGAF